MNFILYFFVISLHISTFLTVHLPSRRRHYPRCVCVMREQRSRAPLPLSQSHLLDCNFPLKTKSEKQIKLTWHKLQLMCRIRNDLPSDQVISDLPGSLSLSTGCDCSFCVSLSRVASRQSVSKCIKQLRLVWVRLDRCQVKGRGRGGLNSLTCALRARH